MIVKEPYDTSEKIILVDRASYMMNIGQSNYYNVDDALSDTRFVVSFPKYISDLGIHKSLIKVRGYIKVYGNAKTHLYLGTLSSKERDEYINKHPEYFI